MEDGEWLGVECVMRPRLHPDGNHWPRAAGAGKNS
jgi:hypothetical protein